MSNIDLNLLNTILDKDTKQIIYNFYIRDLTLDKNFKSLILGRLIKYHKLDHYFFISNDDNNKLIYEMKFDDNPITKDFKFEVSPFQIINHFNMEKFQMTMDFSSSIGRISSTIHINSHFIDYFEGRINELSIKHERDKYFFNRNLLRANKYLKHLKIPHIILLNKIAKIKNFSVKILDKDEKKLFYLLPKSFQDVITQIDKKKNDCIIQ